MKYYPNNQTKPTVHYDSLLLLVVVFINETIIIIDNNNYDTNCECEQPPAIANLRYRDEISHGYQPVTLFSTGAGHEDELLNVH